MSFGELATKLLKELVPTIDVGRDIGELLALAVLTEYGRACLVQDLTFTGEFLVQTSPHGKSISFLRLAACKLSPSKVKLLWYPICYDLLELDGNVAGILSERTEPTTGKGSERKVAVGLG